MATSAEQLILRGIQLLLRTTFAPNDQIAATKHFVALQQDIGPWFADYVTEMEKPAVDFTLTPFAPDDGGGQGGLQQ